ncbi:SH3 domain-containing protein [Leptolyngbya sp. CCNP1308]|uniref:SH3 domain-containing protein n=1 Tax=Leptolyngbya sp. CCNP1308 TaxID=3110255 RepID=UPI002B1F0CA1|nr:SH3 domain-containing protein [Leptolyngbya sp. CCNP1308]MEA5452052.1 SH3 domain-containing protein [Leptolyngbya sp. CCNP1308]
MKAMMVAQGLLIGAIATLATASSLPAQSTYYCTDDDEADVVAYAETGSIPGFVYGQTPGSVVNVRDRPSFEGKVVGTVRVGQQVSLPARVFSVDSVPGIGPECNLWYQVGQGWIHAEFIRLAEFAPR